MNNKEILKGYAQFDKEDWAKNAVRLKYIREVLIVSLPALAFEDGWLDGIIEAYRGAAIKRLLDNDTFMSKSKCGEYEFSLHRGEKEVWGDDLDEVMIKSLKEIEG